MRKALLILILCICGQVLSAQRPSPGQRLVPNRVTLQYAGSTGWLTAGVGYTLDKQRRGSLDLMYGYVPEKFGGPIHALSLKGMYDIWPIRITDELSVSPLQIGMFVSYTMGSDFYLFWPKGQYPFLYYWWSSGLRIHPILHPELRFKPQQGMFKGKTIAGYFELNSNDLYIISWLSNTEYVHPGRIIKLGAGLTFTF